VTSISSLTSSGARNGSSASDAGSVPTSSIASSVPFARMLAVAASRLAGALAVARSVISCTIVRREHAMSIRSLNHPGCGRASEAGSTLIKIARLWWTSAASAARSAEPRQTQSNSVLRPAAEAAPNRAPGLSRALSAGPRDSAS